MKFSIKITVFLCLIGLQAYASEKQSSIALTRAQQLMGHIAPSVDIPGNLNSTAHQRIDGILGHIAPELQEYPFDVELNQCAGISQDAIDIFQKRLIEKKEIKLPLNTIIEWNLSGNHQFFIDSLNGKSSEINPTRTAMAKKWVRNASTRIFNDLNRSFLEIVVNAFDAMLPEDQSVGKFGMGFFSLLSFLDLIETDGAIIAIDTTALDKNGKPFTFTMHIEKNTAQDIYVTFKLQETPNTQTGSKIAILPKNTAKSFSPGTIENIYRYLHFLQFYENGTINLTIERNGTLQNEKLCAGTNTTAIAQVALSSQELSATDKGSGITVPVALTKLLVPSSSSKGNIKIKSLEDAKKEALNNISKPQLVNFKGKTKENLNYSHFLIKINGVVVIAIPNKQKEIENQIVDSTGHIKDLLISMPQITQLTLARNEIYINPDGKSFEETYLKKVIENAINTILLINDSTDQKTLVENQLLISALYNAFDYWEKQTAAEHVNGLFTSYIKEVLAKLLESKKNIFPVHPLFYSMTKSICDTFLGTTNQQCTLLPIDASIVSYSYSKLENFLKAQFLTKASKIENPTHKSLFLKGINQELIAGKIILFVPEDVLKNKTGKPTITDAGLRQTLFIPISFLQQSTNEDALTNKIINYFTQTILSSYNKNPENSHQKVFLINKDKAGDFYCSRLYDLPNDKITFLTQNQSQLADEFLNTHKELIKNLQLPDENRNSILRFIECYGKDCKEAFHRHSEDNEKFEYNIDIFHPAIATVDHLVVQFRKFFTAFKNIHNGQRDALLEGPFRDDEFPHVFCKILENTIFFDEATNTFHKFDNAKAKRLFINEFRTNQAFKELAQLNAPEYFSRRFEAEAKPLLLKLIKDNNLLGEKINSLNLVNFIFYKLLQNSELRTRDYILEYNHNIEIFPKLDKNLIALENLFLSLVSRKNYENFYWRNYVEPILSKNISVQSKGLNKELVRKAITEKLEEIPVSLEYQNTLTASIENLNIPSTLVDSLVAYLNIRDESKLTESNKKSYFEFRNSMLGMYKHYFKINDNDIAYNYGYGDRVKAIHPTNDVTGNELITLLQKIDPNPTLYNKLLEFQITDFIFQTNSMVKSQDLLNKKFYVPSLFANTPVSILAYLLKSGVHENIIKIILQDSRNSAELMYISYLIALLHSNPTIKLLLRNENKEIENNLKVIIKTLIQEKVDQDRIIKIYNENRSKNSIKERLESFSTEPIAKNIQSYLADLAQNSVNFARKQSFVASKLKLPDTKKFTLKQLINAHCTGTGLSALLPINDPNIKRTPAQLNSIIEHINKQENELEFGKIEQSVEAGSEKSPVCGTITECLQNSIDSVKQFITSMQQNKTEIRESLKARYSTTSKVLDAVSSIEFSLATIPSKIDNNNHLSLTIRDHIGFATLKSLITDFLLPDYSNKRPDLGNVGDMGNGSFKMYQQAEFVSIITRPVEDPTKVYMLTIVPLRNKLTNRVEDLSITLRDITAQVPKTLFGTTIRIVFLPEPSNRNDINLLYVKDFLTNTVGATDITLPHGKKITIYLKNGKEAILLNKPTKTVFQTVYPETGKVKFKVNQRESDYLQSFITTGGVPFRTLPSLCKQMNLLPTNFITDFSFGYLVDLDINSYEPVQSRTLLQMNKENHIQLKQALLDAYFIIGLHKGINNSNYFDKVFTHFGSSCHSLEQVSLSSQLNETCNEMINNFLNSNSVTTMEPELFFTYYKPSWADKSFYHHIKEVYDTILDSVNAQIKENKRLIEEWHTKNKNDLTTIATSEDKALAEQLKEKLANEFKPLREKCAHAIETIFNNWKFQFKTSKNETANLFETNVVIPWVFKKAEGISTGFKNALMEIPTINKDGGKNKSSSAESIYSHNLNIVSLFNDLMKHSLLSYCNLFLNKIGVTDIQNKLSNASFYYNPYQLTSGFYVPKTKELKINLAFVSVADYFEMLIRILENDATGIRLNKTYNELFANNAGNEATLTHELEHARREDSHNGPHGPGLDAEGNMSNFRQCANSFSRKAQEAGLLQDWIADIRNFYNSKVDARNRDSEKESMKKYALSNVRRVEAENKISLMQELGYLFGAKL